MRWCVRENEKENEVMEEKEIRDRGVYIVLTEEEEAILYKLTEELNTGDDVVVGKALRVLQKCREFIES